MITIVFEDCRKIHLCEACERGFERETLLTNYDTLLAAVNTKRQAEGYQPIASRESVANTPGPWEYDDGFVYGYNESERYLVCTVANDTEEAKPAQDAANGPLIAAAPELLAACELALKKMPSQVFHGECIHIAKTLRNAIDKAKGL